MADQVQDAVFEVLKKIQNDLAAIRQRVESGFSQTNTRLVAVEQQLAGLTTAVYGGHSRTDELERRIERIERRLELSDENP